MNYEELKDFLDSFPCFESGKFPHKYIMFDLTREVNRPIKELLQETGYWKWRPTYSQSLASYHQIVAWFCVSKNKINQGVCHPDIHLHHLDGNTLNNRPSNLIYLSKEDHALVTKYQNLKSPLKLKTFFSLEKKFQGIRTTFTRAGNKLVSWTRFILFVISKTVVLTICKWGVKTHARNISITVFKIAKKFINSWFETKAEHARV